MLHQQNCSQTNKIEQAHMLQVRHLDFNPKKQHIMVKLKLNTNFPKPSCVPFSSLIYGIDPTFFLQGGGQRWENKWRMKLCGLCGWVDGYFIMVKSVSISLFLWFLFCFSHLNCMHHDWHGCLVVEDNCRGRFTDSYLGPENAKHSTTRAAWSPTLVNCSKHACARILCQGCCINHWYNLILM
jgi:hypothetical protein